MRPIGHQNNILRTYYQATSEEIQAGLTWYKSMGELALRMMRDANQNRKRPYRLTKTICYGIISALSPQKSWVRNLHMAAEFIETGKVGQFSAQVDKAREILAGANPEQILKGRKELSFYHCFMNPNTSAVTIDGHALNIWLGLYVSVDKTKVTERLYRLAAEDYRAVASTLGIAPYQLQAITWLAWRRLNRSTGHTQDKRNGL
jgi:hypothetical protein